MTDLRARYRQALGFDPLSGDKRAKAALARAHELRRFEIENYWRRATYAWAFQATALAALAFVYRDTASPLLAPVTAFGGLSALAAALTARGSKFWQQNWEGHVDLLEDAIEGRLHKTVIARDGRGAHSVSRVNQRFLWLLAAG